MKTYIYIFTGILLLLITICPILYHIENKVFNPLQSQELRKIFLSYEKIKKRCDDKYAHPGCALSAFLYSDEFEMLVLAFLMEASYKYSGTTLQCDDKLSDIEENNSLKNNTENN